MKIELAAVQEGRAAKAQSQCLVSFDQGACFSPESGRPHTVRLVLRRSYSQLRCDGSVPFRRGPRVGKDVDWPAGNRARKCLNHGVFEVLDVGSVPVQRRRRFGIEVADVAVRFREVDAKQVPWHVAKLRRHGDGDSSDLHLELEGAVKPLLLDGWTHIFPKAECHSRVDHGRTRVAVPLRIHQGTVLVALYLKAERNRQRFRLTGLLRKLFVVLEEATLREKFLLPLPRGVAKRGITPDGV